MNANCFEQDLAWSESQHSEDWWEPYYRKAFPLLQSIQRVPGPSEAQRAGIDKFVILQGGKRLAVDEKIRRDRPPNDIALEIRHVAADRLSEWPGWMTKPNQFTDYLAMGFQKFHVAFFFPFGSLQAAWCKNGEKWKSQYGIVEAPNPRDNPRYYTQNVCVPTGVLMGYLLDAMRVQF